MNKLVVAAAFVLGMAMAQQAIACEWMHEAAKPATVVTCDNDGCTAQQPAQEAAAATETTPAAPQQTATEGEAPPASALVASVQR